MSNVCHVFEVKRERSRRLAEVDACTHTHTLSLCLSRKVLLGVQQKLVVVDIALPSEEENVGLGFVDGVVNPATALLDSDGTPLVFLEECVLGEVLRDIGRQDDVPVGGDYEFRAVGFRWDDVSKGEGNGDGVQERSGENAKEQTDLYS